jgi:hypothetical protein
MKTFLFVVNLLIGVMLRWQLIVFLCLIAEIVVLHTQSTLLLIF